MSNRLTMKKILFLLCIAIAFASTACEEDELKVPVKVNIDFDMYTFVMEDEAKGDPVLTIDEGNLVISGMEIDGDRDEGEDYFFESAFDPSLFVDLHMEIASQDVTYEFPQGVYKKIEFSLTIGDEEHDALSLRGICNKAPLENVPLLFEYPISDILQVGATNIDGKKEIVLTHEEGEPVTATIILDVPNLFKLFNWGMIKQAELTSIEDEDVLLINNETNINIFNILAIRLEQSMQVVFE
jgi:hypothetical protein